MIEFAPFWTVIAILMFIAIAFIAMTFVIETYIHFMEYKWNKNYNKIKQLVGEIIDEKLNVGGGF